MDKAASIALGFFDGVHIAHQEIIKRCVNGAREKNLRPIALTFDVSPHEFLGKGAAYITDNGAKSDIIRNLGCETHFLKTTAELLKTEPSDFVRKVLMEEYGAKYIVCGFNYHFGKNAAGNVKLLGEIASEYGAELCVCECVTVEDERVSSSKIRSLIKDGNIKKANKMLGRRFSIQGIVSQGKHLGKTIGFPTANIYISENMIAPKFGVYHTIVTIGEDRHHAITNVGINPTLGGEKLRTETYIPGLDMDLYNKTIKLEFIDFLRPEKKFSGISQLKRQIESDLERMMNDNEAWTCS